jgi:hypothetical protein
MNRPALSLALFAGSRERYVTSFDAVTDIGDGIRVINFELANDAKQASKTNVPAILRTYLFPICFSYQTQPTLTEDYGEATCAYLLLPAALRYFLY